MNVSWFIFKYVFTGYVSVYVVYVYNRIFVNNINNRKIYWFIRQMILLNYYKQTIRWWIVMSTKLILRLPE